MTASAEQIQEQLQRAGHEASEVFEIDPMRNDLDRHGKLFHARDRFKKVWENRLRGYRLYKPDNAAIFIPFVEDMLRNLQEVEDQETLCSWKGRFDGKFVRGVSTEKRLICIFPDFDFKDGTET